MKSYEKTVGRVRIEFGRLGHGYVQVFIDGVRIDKSMDFQTSRELKIARSEFFWKGQGREREKRTLPELGAAAQELATRFNEQADRLLCEHYQREVWRAESAITSTRETLDFWEKERGMAEVLLQAARRKEKGGPNE